MERLNVEDLISQLIEREGGFVDHPADRGGPTKYGITQKTLDAWLASHPKRVGWGFAANHKVQELTHSQAFEIYESAYYRDPSIDELPEPWQPLVFDWAVNSGPVAAIKALQMLCASHRHAPGRIDGVIGPKTIAAAAAYINAPLHQYLGMRRDFCLSICESDPSQKVFLKGWMNRIDGLEKDL